MEACTLDSGKLRKEMDMVFGFRGREKRFTRGSFYMTSLFEDTTSECCTRQLLLKYECGECYVYVNL
jgi:hypothetical protein